MNSNKASGLKKALKRAFSIYTGIVFFLVFITLLPLFFLFVITGKKRHGLILTRHFTTIFYFLIGMKIVIENKHLLDKKSNYIYCPNHFSFMDITIMTQMPIAAKFVGKESLSKIPGFGYYFRKFHIMVDRDSLRSRYKAFKESIEALQKGFSLTVFPEGGINVTHSKDLSEFKEGPFRMALETGVHLVPITIADNWRILPDDGNFMVNWRRKSRVIIHEPIDPSKYSLGTLKEFQAEVKSVIQTELDSRNDSRACIKIRKAKKVGSRKELSV
ncbi:lysophospholipid acyltransferase family protein [Ekhidna sp.]|uniref:lysophospholipid acyltransferase family protein n=1 Tax=Ekhidna sp. TaxID=2608089 RepID=UPI0032EC259F